MARFSVRKVLQYCMFIESRVPLDLAAS